MGDPVGFYTANRRPSGPPPRQYSTAYEDQFYHQPNVSSEPHRPQPRHPYEDPYYERARTPDPLTNGTGPRGRLKSLKSQDPPHQEPIWPSNASVDDPFVYHVQVPKVEQIPVQQVPLKQVPLRQVPVRQTAVDHPHQEPYDPYQDRSPDMLRDYRDYPDDRYINPPDPRMQRARTPDNLDDGRHYAPRDPYRRPRTPDNLDDRAYPRDRYSRPQTPDALDDRYPPRQIFPDRAQRARTPDMLDGRPPRPHPAPVTDPYRRARTPEILDDRPPKFPDNNRYNRARTPEPLEEKPRYHTMDNRQPLSPRQLYTPDHLDDKPQYHTMDNRQPLSPRPVEGYQRARTPDFLDGYPSTPWQDYTNGDHRPFNRQPSRSPSYAEPRPLQRAPSTDAYYELDPYGHARSTDNLDDVWGQMMTGHQDYENYIPDLVMTACKRDETLTVRVDRVTRDQVDVSRAHHIGDGPFKDIIINKPIRKLPEVDEPEIKMKFLVHMKDKRNTDGAKEVRELRYWFKPYINDDDQTDNAKEYFKTLLKPEDFPRDYVGFLKKALVMTRGFPMVSRLEIAMYPAPPDADKRASFIDTQEEQVVVNKMQPLMDPATYGGRGGPGVPGSGGSVAFRDRHGPDIFAKVKQDDGREFYKDTADDDDDDIDYDQIIENFITVLTPNVYDYQYLPEVPVSDKRFVVFQVKANADAHIALSSVYGDTDRKTYEVVIGGWNNKKSCIRYGGQGDIVEEATTFNILSGEELRRFWISWDRGLVQVGEGRRKGADTFLRWKIPDNRQFSINCLAVSTGQDSKGEWEFVELIRPKTAEGLNFNYKTEKAPTHSIVTRIRRKRQGPSRGPRPQAGDIKLDGTPIPRADKRPKAVQKSVPPYATMPRAGSLPPGENIKAYPKMERSNTIQPRPKKYDGGRPPRPVSMAVYPSLDRRDRPPRPVSQADILDQPSRPLSRSDVIDYEPAVERPSSTRPTSDDIKAFPRLERSLSRSRSGSFSKPSDDGRYNGPPGYHDLDKRAIPLARAASKPDPYRQVPVKVFPTDPARDNRDSNPLASRPPMPTGSLRREPGPNAARKQPEEEPYAQVRKRDARPPSAPYGARHPEERMSPERGKPPHPIGSKPPKPKPAPLDLHNYNPDPRTQALPGYGRGPPNSNEPVSFDEVKLRPKEDKPEGKKSRPRSYIVTLTKNPKSPKYVPSTPPGLMVDDEDNEELRLADPRYTPRSPRRSFAYSSLPASSRRNPRASWSPIQGADPYQPYHRSYSPAPPSIQSTQSSAFRTVGTPRHLGTVR